MPSAPALASSGLDLVRPMASLDLERLMADLIPKLTPTKRRELRYLVRGLKTRKEIGGIPSVSAALVARAPALVGAHLWRACVEKQRREPEPRPAFLDDVPDDVFKIIARFAAAAKATRDAPDGLRALFLSHRRGRNVAPWREALRDVGVSFGADVTARHMKRVYLHLGRARLLWEGASRPTEESHLTALLARGLRTDTIFPINHKKCHFTGLDMQYLNSRRIKGPKLWRDPVPWRRYHRAFFEFGGDRWDIRLERKRLMRLRCHRENTGSSSDEADFDDDDDELCLTVQKMPFEACRPTCNCAYDFPLRVAVLAPVGPTGYWEHRMEWNAVSGCWFSRGLGSCYEWVRAVDKAEAVGSEEPVRLLVTAPEDSGFAPPPFRITS